MTIGEIYYPFATHGRMRTATFGPQASTTVTIADNDAPAAGTISVGPGATGALWTGSVLNAQATANPFSRGFEKARGNLPPV